MAKHGKRARIRVSGAPVVLTDEPMEVVETDGSTYTVLRITDATRRVLTATDAVKVVRTYNLTDTDETYRSEVNRLNGTVRIPAAFVSGTTWKISGKYHPMAIAAECHEFSTSLTRAVAEAAHFEEDWNKRSIGLLDATGSLSQWTSATRMFAKAVEAQTPVVLEVWEDKTAAEPTFIVRALILSDDASGGVGGTQDSSVSWEGTPDIDGRVVSIA